MIRSSLLALLSFLFGAVAVSAQTFMKSYGTTTVNEGGKAIVASPDGNYFIGGYRADSALIMKVDASGGILWAKCFRSQTIHPEVISELAITQDGYLIGVSNSFQSSGNPYRFSYFKFDLSGNAIWIKSSTGPGEAFCHGIVARSSQEYVLISSIYETSGPLYNDPIQQGVSGMDGSINWTGPRYNYVPDPYIDDAYAGVPDSNQNIYTTGRIYLSSSDPGSMRPFISKFNSNGQHLWTKYYIAGPNSSARVYGIDIILNNDSFTLCYFGNPVQYTNDFQIGLIHTDSAGVFSWGKNYQIANFTSETSYKVLKMPYGYCITGFGVGGGNDLFVVAVSNLGDVLWAKGYGSSSTTEDIKYTVGRNAIAINSDLLFTGQTGNTVDKDLLLVRVDDTGSVDCGVEYDLNVITTVLPSYTATLSPTGTIDNINFLAVTATSTSPITDHCSDPGPFLGNDTATCSAITLTAPSLGPGTTYQWENGQGGPDHTVSTPGTYWATVTVNCCTFSDTVIVLPGAAPEPAFFTTSTCSQSVTFSNTSNNATTYLWDFGDGQTDSSAQPVHNYDSTGTYMVTLYATNGCGTADTTMQVQVQAGGTFSINGPDSLCADQDGAYTATLVNASLAGIAWSSGADSASITFSSSTTTSLYAIATDTNNCTYTDTIAIHIDPAPHAAFFFDALPCDSVVHFIDGSSGADQWAWDLGNGESSTAPSAIGHYGSYGTFTVQQVVTNTCGTDTAEQQLTLGPTGILNLAGPDTICANVAVTYTADLQGTGAAQVAWSMGGSDSTSILLNLSGDSVLDVSVIGDDGCTYTASLAIQVSPAPIADFSVSTNPCDSSASFINQSSQAQSYQWDFGNGNTSSSISPTAFFNPVDSNFVTLVAMNGCGADSTGQQLVFAAMPEFTMVGPAKVCSDAPINLQVVYAGTGLHGIQWSNGDTATAITISPVDGEEITVTAFNDEGCSLTSSYTVHFVGDDGVGAAYIPNVFTPNHDGSNEVFIPVIPDGFISMTIFNRWGQEIYETKASNNPWHGDYKGNPVPDGTYVYIIKWKDACTATPVERIGHVTVLR